jgi:hypothetical protein
MKKFDDIFPLDESDNESLELECIRQKLLQQRAEPNNDDNDDGEISMSSNSSEELNGIHLKDSTASTKAALKSDCAIGTASQPPLTTSNHLDATQSVRPKNFAMILVYHLYLKLTFPFSVRLIIRGPASATRRRLETKTTRRYGNSTIQHIRLPQSRPTFLR